MYSNRKSYFSVYITAAMAIFITLSLVMFPEHAFEAAVNGLNVWWNVVFPALLPFFICAEILMGLGVVHFMGVLLEPLMRPVFNVPGEGSFVMAMGLASGFPIGSILTTRLREQNMCTKLEGERLMSFTNTADPLFMFGAVAVGMFGNAALGATIAIAHYLSSLSTGLIMRFHGYNQEKPVSSKRSGSIILRALTKLYEARKKDGRPLGQLMGDAILKSMNTLLLIGGFIILFSVLIKIMEVLGALSLLSAVLFKILAPIGIEPGLIPSLIHGFFEVTLGSQQAGAAPAAVPLIQKTMAAGFIIAWSGLSVHAQVASIISKTDMSIRPFFFARFIHGILAAIYTFLLMKPAQTVFREVSVPVFLHTQPQSTISFWLERLIFISSQLFLFVLILLCISMVIYLYTNMAVIVFRLTKKRN